MYDLDGNEVDTHGMHVIPDDNDSFFDTHIQEVEVCGFEGDGDALDSVIEYMDTDSRTGDVCSVLGGLNGWMIL